MINQKNNINKKPMEDIKEKLKKLQLEYSNEHTLYRKRIIKEKIEDLRKEYKKMENLEIELREKEYGIKLHKNKNKEIINIINEEDKKYNYVSCDTILIENSKNIYFEVERSEMINIRNVYNLTLIGRFNQIRITNSKHIRLKVFTSSPISLEESTDIEISSIDSQPGNLFNIVHDFSNLLDSTNYKIVNEEK